jgi:phage shock protein PspC (stress-responsive transcriptional regulator)
MTLLTLLMPFTCALMFDHLVLLVHKRFALLNTLNVSLLVSCFYYCTVIHKKYRYIRKHNDLYYFRIMFSALIHLIERNSFGVCSYLADKIGLRSSRVRLYFIYASFVTFGSPIVLYLAVAFWMNIKQYLRKSKSFLFN